MFGDKRRLLMSGGAIAVLVVVMWSMRPASAPSSAVAPAPARQVAGQAAPAAPPPVPPVKLASLEAEREQPSESNRNPFRYQPKVVPPPPPRPAPIQTPEPATIEAPKPITPPGPPPAPPIPLKFIGLLERANGVKWAVLSDGKNVMHGREGDIVEGRYRIVKIGTESVELTHVDGRGRQVVRLTGQ
jgi:hypothetical protein